MHVFRGFSFRGRRSSDTSGICPWTPLGAPHQTPVEACAQALAMCVELLLQNP